MKMNRSECLCRGEQISSPWMDKAKWGGANRNCVGCDQVWTKYAPQISLSLVDRGSLHCGIIDLGTLHSIGLPTHVYPLYENAFRAHRGQSLQENDEESARLYAGFAEVSERNPLAWNYGQAAATKDEIKTVTPSNRMICYPCKILLS
jgi:hypothetical protein